MDLRFYLAGAPSHGKDAHHPAPTGKAKDYVAFNLEKTYITPTASQVAPQPHNPNSLSMMGVAAAHSSPQVRSCCRRFAAP